MNGKFQADLSLLNALLNRHDKNLSIVEGETLSAIKKEVLRICPHQKVLLIKGKSRASEYKKIVESLKENNLTVISTSVPYEPLSVESVSKLFLLPEDIRAVICIDYELFDYAVYYSSVISAHLILAPSRLNLINAIKPSVKIKNGEGIDEIITGQGVTLIIDRDKIKNLTGELKSTYESVISLSLSLIEYRILRLLKLKKTYRESYEIIKNSVTDVFNLIAYDKNARNEVLAISTLRVAVANYVASGEILSDTIYSACVNFGEEDNVLDLSTKVLRLTKYAFTEMKNTGKLTNYDEHADFIKEKFKLEKAYIYAKFLSSAQAFIKLEHEIKKFFSINSAEIDGLINSLLKAKNISNNLGGATKGSKETKSQNRSLKYLGDLNTNLCTFLREKGVLELI